MPLRVFTVTCEDSGASRPPSHLPPAVLHNILAWWSIFCFLSWLQAQQGGIRRRGSVPLPNPQGVFHLHKPNPGCPRLFVDVYFMRLWLRLAFTPKHYITHSLSNEKWVKWKSEPPKPFNARNKPANPLTFLQTCDLEQSKSVERLRAKKK